jgi:hypothetical protein
MCRKHKWPALLVLVELAVGAKMLTVIGALIAGIPVLIILILLRGVLGNLTEDDISGMVSACCTSH